MRLKLQIILFFLIPVISFAQCPPDGIFNSQAEIDAFVIDYPNCTSFSSSNLIISGLDINDLSALSNLTYAPELYIENNPILTSLSGLDNLQSNLANKTSLHIIDNPILVNINALQGLTACPNIDIINNDQLVSLDGLSSLTFMGMEIITVFPFHWLDISDNDNLTNISGLTNLIPSAIDGLRVKNNPSLTSLEGLEEFRSFNSIEIENNDALIDLTGLNNLKNLYIGFNIIDNDGITSLNELGTLEQVANFVVEGNDMLTSLNGLGEITNWYSIGLINNTSLSDISVIENFPEDFTNQLTLTGNTSLAVCNYNFVCYFLVNAESSNVQVENNAEGCNSVQEILSGCTVCPENSSELVFSSQQDIDDYFANYPNCTVPEGVLRIEGPDITNLDGLTGITSVGGLQILNNPLLTTVDGLNSLTSFTNFSGFLFLNIANNPLLANITGLANAVNDYPMDISISNNPQLISLNGLQGIQGVGYGIGITNNDLLVDLNGLNGFVNIDDLYIQNNDALASFNGLDNLDITGSFLFENNDAMTSFTSLNDINPLCGFAIRDNANLTDIDGFVNVYQEGCAPNIIIENNPILAICNTSFVCSAVPSLGIFSVSNNAEGCDTISDITNACGIAPFNNDITCSNYYSIPQLTLGETLSSSNVNATASTYIPSCNDDVNRQDVWFSLNLDSNVVVDITVNNGFSMQLWEGNCSALTQVSGACAENVLNDISITANTFYYLQVWLNSTSGRSTTFDDFEIIIQDTALSVSDLDVDSFKLFPNPFNDQLHVSANRDIENVQVYDAQGKLVKSLEINERHTTLNLSEFQVGIYFLKIFNKGFTVTRKVIKQ